MTGRRVAHALVVLMLAAACGRSPEAKPSGQLESVEVTPKPDAAASLAGDTTAPKPGRTKVMAGAMPDDFPRDIPLPRPASLIDFSGRSVTFEVEGSPEEARSSYVRQLRAAGYISQADGKWRRGKRLLSVAGKPGNGGVTHLVVEILPGG